MHFLIATLFFGVCDSFLVCLVLLVFVHFRFVKLKLAFSFPQSCLLCISAFGSSSSFPQCNNSNYDNTTVKETNTWWLEVFFFLVKGLCSYQTVNTIIPTRPGSVSSAHPFTQTTAHLCCGSDTTSGGAFPPSCTQAEHLDSWMRESGRMKQ